MMVYVLVLAVALVDDGWSSSSRCHLSRYRRFGDFLRRLHCQVLEVQNDGS